MGNLLKELGNQECAPGVKKGKKGEITSGFRFLGALFLITPPREGNPPIMPTV